MTAPAWQSRTTLTGASAANAIVTYPASIGAGDLIICNIYKENTNAVTTVPAGWTELTGGGIPPQTTAPQKHHVFYYLAGGGETGTITFAWTGSVFRAADVHRVTGQWGGGDPMDKRAGAFSNSAITSLPVSVTGDSPESLFMLIGTNFAGGNAWAPPGGGLWTERTDIDVLGVATAVNTSPIGSVSLVANVSGAMTMAMITILGSGGPVAPAGAGLWTPRDLPDVYQPGNPVFFPFQRPIWAGETSAVQASAGDGVTVQRSSAAGNTAAKATTGAGIDPQRSATVGSGTRAAVGAASAAQRSRVLAVSGKVATGAGVVTARTATAASVRKQASGVGTDPNRSQTSTADVKAATGTGVTPQRAITVGTGATVQGNAGVTVTRNATTTADIKQAAGSGVTACRSATAVTSRKQAAAAGATDQRSRTANTSQKGGTGTGAVANRTRTAAAGAKTGLAAAVTACRDQTAVGSRKQALAAAQDPQRSMTAATSQTGGNGQLFQRGVTSATGAKVGQAAVTVSCRSRVIGAGAAVRTGAGNVQQRAHTRAQATKVIGGQTGLVTCRTQTRPTTAKLAAGVGRVVQRSDTRAVHLLDQTPIRIRTGGRENDTTIGHTENDTTLAGREPATIAAGRENDRAVGYRENDTTIGGREQGT